MKKGLNVSSFKWTHVPLEGEVIGIQSQVALPQYQGNVRVKLSKHLDISYKAI